MFSRLSQRMFRRESSDKGPYEPITPSCEPITPSEKGQTSPAPPEPASPPEPALEEPFSPTFLSRSEVNEVIGRAPQLIAQAQTYLYDQLLDGEISDQEFESHAAEWTADADELKRLYDVWREMIDADAGDSLRRTLASAQHEWEQARAKFEEARIKRRRAEIEMQHYNNKQRAALDGWEAEDERLLKKFAKWNQEAANRARAKEKAAETGATPGHTAAE